MKTLEEFEVFYKTELLDTLTELEGIRKKILKFKRNVIVLIAIIAVFLLFFIKSEEFEIQTKAFVILGTIFMTAIYVIPNANRVYNYKFRIRFKQEVIHSIIKFVSPDFTYRPTIYIRQKDFEKSRIFLENIGIYKGDDYVGGMIENTQFGFSEIKALIPSTTHDTKNIEAVFHGMFFVADFNKGFDGSTVLLPNGLGSRFRIVRKIAGLTRREKLVDLEDSEFSNYYTCYSDDDIKARYILSNALMQRIVEFRKLYPKNTIYFSFVDGVMYMAVSYNKPLFEPSYTASLLDSTIVREYFMDIKLAVDVVESLNLNTRIWSKH